MQFSVKKIEEIITTHTSHGVGRKKILLSQNETDSAITQIARSYLKKGLLINAHIHPTMEEYFYILSGSIEFLIEGKIFIATSDDFVCIGAKQSHQLNILSDATVITIGVAVHEVSLVNNHL